MHIATLKFGSNRYRKEFNPGTTVHSAVQEATTACISQWQFKPYTD